ncbi:hypothetical protein BDZ45DRAFT_699527 [Acephala macrosclerotiorum]|nr:hypothetical protein BDZ45DRAFT_699527 [Acephala macrosclerotiorum]
MKKYRQDEKEIELLRSLLKAANNYKRNKDFNPIRDPGMCEWFLKDERYCQWRHSMSSDLFWVSAGPGRGKSVLSRFLIDQGQLTTCTTTIEITLSSIEAKTSRELNVCYFFFKDGGEGNMDSAHAMSCVTSSNVGEIIVVLNALDECKEGSRQELIRAFKEFHSPREKLSKLKFLVTSRPYDYLETSFQGVPESQAYLHLDGAENSDEIRKEIDFVIDHRLLSITSRFTTEDKKKISEHLKGMVHRKSWGH